MTKNDNSKIAVITTYNGKRGFTTRLIDGFIKFHLRNNSTNIKHKKNFETPQIYQENMKINYKIELHHYQKVNTSEIAVYLYYVLSFIKLSKAEN